MKKISALLLLAVLVLGMISCGKTENEPSAEGDGTDTPEEIDLYGYDFKFIALTDYETFFKPDAVSSDYGDKILARYASTAKKFNAEVNVEAVTSTDTELQEILKANTIGMKYADLVDITSRVIFQNKENFEILNDIEGFDISLDKWGPSQYLETTTFDKNNYGFIAYYWGMPYPQYIGNLYFMKAVICDEFGLVNPQELYENGKWYWEDFRDYSRQLTVIDNVTPANSRYGFVVSGEMKMPRAFIISNGVQLIDYNETTGLYQSNIENPNVAEALSFLKDMVDEGIGYYTTDAWQVAAQMFKDKRTAFYEAFNKHSFVTAELHLASDLGEEYSWLPYPCGPHGTYGTSTAQFWYTARFLAMPLASDADSLDNAVIIINDLFEPLDGETTTSWQDVVYANYFFDDLSFKYYIDLFENGHTDYSTVAYDAVISYHVAVYNAVLSGRKSIAEAISAQTDKINQDIDKNLNHIG